MPLSGRQWQREQFLDDEMDLHPHPDEKDYLEDMAEAHNVMSGEVWWRGGQTPSEVLELQEPEDEERRAA